MNRQEKGVRIEAKRGRPVANAMKQRKEERKKGKAEVDFEEL
jgi:hypothetical protein